MDAMLTAFDRSVKALTATGLRFKRRRGDEMPGQFIIVAERRPA